MVFGWDVNTIATVGIRLLVIVVLTLLGIVATHAISRRLTKAAQATTEGKPERRQQLKTLIQVGRWSIQMILVVAAVIMVLSNFVDVAPLLASVGVVGLALGLGAQTLVKDFIGGAFILIENQYAVGDVVQLGGVSGSVEKITLRTTQVRAVDGSLHTVPNGEVRIVANATRDWSRAMVDLGIAYEENLERVRAVLEGVVDGIVDDPEYGQQLLERPNVLLPLNLGDWAIGARVMVKTPAGEQWGVTRELRTRLLAACERENIVLPYPRQEVFTRSVSD
jgi:small conductance mechanosensitive channel